ncbi:unnamed protein product [Amoebophrya sp. A120]|nr:unnamed protein product [Amoebophrya sp. A120]|eukprot:GSA120T00019009001.1
MDLDETRRQFGNPILGIDIGSSTAKVAFISERGTTVEIVQNEVNNRATPSVIGFTNTQRLEGDKAHGLIKSNLKNSVRYFKHLLQLPSSSEISNAGAAAGGAASSADSMLLKNEEFWSLCPLKVVDGVEKAKIVGFEVSYLGDKQVYSVMQIISMLLVKIRHIALKWCSFFAEEGADATNCNGLTDDKKLNVVLSCPAYYTDGHRRALIKAASLAGMKVLRIMTDGAAAAVSYGPYRVDELVKEPMHVAFCGCGHSTSFVAIARFTKDGLQLVSETCDQFGARDMDLALMKHFAAEFQTKHKLDPLTNKKACLKLEEAIQKTKKILSSNDEAPLGVECLVEDYDLSGKVTRETFEDLCEPLKLRLRTLIVDAVQRACLDVSQIDSVEIIGGASRVQWVQRVCEECFQTKTLSRTLNADEAVVRGCALQAAIYSPLYKVRDYNVWLYSQRGVSVSWNADGKQETFEVFPSQSSLNLMRSLSLFRQKTFELSAFVTENPAVKLGTYKIEVDNPDRAKIQVKAKLDAHGIFSIDSATLVPSDPAVAVQPLSISCSDLPGACSPEVFAKLKNTELEFQAQAIKVQKLEDLRNDVEAEVYRQRSLLQGQALKEKTEESERTEHLKLLQDIEEWIYDHEDELTEEALTAKVDSLRPKFARLEERLGKGATL